MTALGLYFHTIRYLRPTQVLARLWYEFGPRPGIDSRDAPQRRPLCAPYVEPVEPSISLVAADTFRFLNVERNCAAPDCWSRSDVDRLWLYNLHYFDDLNARDGVQRSAWHEHWLKRWVADNAEGEGTGWEPYPLSRRVVNWIKYSLRGRKLPAECHASLAKQARWLMRRLEFHLLGNHLFTNAKALVHAGGYFSGPEAERWLRRGLRIMNEQLQEQVLNDGAHFELSPMYHAAMLEDLLDLINLHRAFAMECPPVLFEAVRRMRRWLAAMTHPDGGLAFFNDSAFGIAPTLADLDAYAERLALPAPNAEGSPLIVLKDSGYVVARVPRAYLVCDCAAVGPDYLPAHAHADTLSFELSVDGRRVLVNSGTSCYGLSPERQRQRSTPAHNTVAVDEQNSSEVWGGFRVARRARCKLLSVRTPIAIEAEHDGYRRLPGRNVHVRRWFLQPEQLTVEDEVHGKFGVAAAYFHLHPEVEVLDAQDRGVTLRSGGVRMRLEVEGCFELTVLPGTWHPEFGVAIENRCVVARFRQGRLRARLAWDRT